jgi:hypothetical protein
MFLDMWGQHLGMAVVAILRRAQLDLPQCEEHGPWDISSLASF